MATPNKSVDWYFTKPTAWQAEVNLLRQILLSCDLTEVLKYGCPAYTLDGSNIALIHTFKNYCALLFYKGALMGDPNHLLIQQTPNVQSARQLRFTSPKHIKDQQNTIKQYILEAVKIQQSGVKLKKKDTKYYEVPKELVTMFDEMPDLKDAFDTLTPGRQHGYLLYFASAKQSKTRIERIKKFIPAIFAGKGLLMSKKLED